MKLHVAFLDDDEFCSMPESSRLAACLLLLVVSRRGNRIPADAGWLAAELHMNRANAKRALADLVATRFLVPASNLASESASTTASNLASKNASGSASNGASASRAHDRALRAEVEVEVETAEQSSYVVEMPAAALPNESLEELGQRLEERVCEHGRKFTEHCRECQLKGYCNCRDCDDEDTEPPSVENGGRAPYGSVDSVFEVIDKPAGNTRRELEKWLPQLEPHQVEHVREQVLACEPRKSKAAYAVGTAQRLARERGAA